MRPSTKLYCLGMSALVASVQPPKKKSEPSPGSHPLLGDETATHVRPIPSQRQAVPSHADDSGSAVPATTTVLAFFEEGSIPVKRAEVLPFVAP